MVDNVLLITGVTPEPKSSARLCNFTTGKSELLPGHKKWLDGTVKPLVQSLQNPWVDLFGYASKLGSAQYNETLSKNRCTAVKDYIRSFNPKTQFPQEYGKGEAESTGDASDNDGYWRAVSLFVYGSKPATRPIIPKLPTKPAPPPLPAWLARIYGLIPSLHLQLLVTLNVLRTASAGLNATTRTPIQVKALGLVNRIFKITNSYGATTGSAARDLVALLKVYNEMGLLAQAIKSGQRYLHASNRPDEKDDLAYTLCGHWAYKKPSDGIWYVEARNTGSSSTDLIDRTVHEFAHFCGPLGVGEIDHAFSGGAAAYGTLVFGLPRKDALVNASSYAYLTFLAQKPSDSWATAT